MTSSSQRRRPAPWASVPLVSREFVQKSTPSFAASQRNWLWLRPRSAAAFPLSASESPVCSGTLLSVQSRVETFGLRFSNLSPEIDTETVQLHQLFTQPAGNGELLSFHYLLFGRRKESSHSFVLLLADSFLSFSIHHLKDLTRLFESSLTRRLELKKTNRLTLIVA